MFAWCAPSKLLLFYFCFLKGNKGFTALFPTFVFIIVRELCQPVLLNKSLMADFIEFADYFLADVRKSVKEETPAKDWALAKAKVLKQLRGFGYRRGAWIKQFAESVQFSGDEDSFVEFLIGYVLTTDVRLNLANGHFEEANIGAKGLSMDPTMKSLLEEQQK